MTERLMLYRAVAAAALQMPRPLRNGNQNIVADEKLAPLWAALDALVDHSEDLEVMF